MYHIRIEVIRWNRDSLSAFGQTFYFNDPLPHRTHKDSSHSMEHIRTQAIRWKNSSLAFGPTFLLNDPLPDGITLDQLTQHLNSPDVSHKDWSHPMEYRQFIVIRPNILSLRMSFPMEPIRTQVIRWNKGSSLAFSQTSYSTNLLPNGTHKESSYLVEKEDNSLALGQTFSLKDILPDRTDMVSSHSLGKTKQLFGLRMPIEWNVVFAWETKTTFRIESLF